MNRYWPKWFEASVYKVFKDACAANGVVFFAEGMDRSGLKNVPKYIELRVDGPYTDELSRNFWQVDLEVNIVVTTVPDHNDIYAHASLIGLAQSMFPDPLKVYKYGLDTTGVDDGSLLGCMNVAPIVSGDRPYRVSRFGQIAPDTRLIQSTVEVHYRGEFDG